MTVACSSRTLPGSFRITNSGVSDGQTQCSHELLPSPHSSAMRQPRSPTLLTLLAAILSSTHTVHSKPLPLGETSEIHDSVLVERQCAYPCGASSQLCCTGAGQCYTDSNNQAQCGSGGTQQGNAVNNGQWQLYTTTYTTDSLVTVTSTYSLQTSATAVVASGSSDTCAPNLSLGESSCGNICCASGQTCQYQGSCVGSGSNDVSSSYLNSVMATAAGSAYIRPTSATTATITSTGSATTTVAYQSPSGTAAAGAAGMQSTTTNNGLTGGQIAGIVIGVLLAILFLLLFCGALCFKGLLDTVLALFGLGPKSRRNRRETVVEERYSHHHSGTGGGAGGRRWFGQGGPSRPQREKKSSGGGLLGVGAGLGALALILGLKRKKNDRKDKESYTASSYSYSDYTSASEY